jgi:hypothetical protein
MTALPFLAAGLFSLSSRKIKEMAKIFGVYLDYSHPCCVFC